jgi:alkanesulfonate monooxygenase SsuD/methylene tetrahydromethanopterin reductase-like flavin-dependent oxidoreductase (luciferase family)
LFNAYRERWREHGFGDPPPEKFAYMGMGYVADTDDEAQEDAKQFVWFLQRTRHPNFGSAPGFESPEVLSRAFSQPRPIAAGSDDERLTIRLGRTNFEQLQAGGGIIAGSPETVIKKITYLYERYGLGHLVLLGRSGFMPAHKVRRSLELLGTEVYPAVRGLGEQREEEVGAGTDSSQVLAPAGRPRIDSGGHPAGLHAGYQQAIQ